MHMQGVTRARALNVAVAISVMALIVSNIITNKQFQLFGIATTCATFLVPFTYICNDVVAEVYGFRIARNVTLLAFFMGFVAVMVFQFAVWVPGIPTFSAQEEFAVVLGAAPRAMGASFVAFIVGSLSNAGIMEAMHRRDGEGRLALRCILSTVIGESIDMVTFSVLAFAGTMPLGVMAEVIISGVVLKSLWETIVYTLATRRVIAWVKTLD